MMTMQNLEVEPDDASSNSNAYVEMKDSEEKLNEESRTRDISQAYSPSNDELRTCASAEMAASSGRIPVVDTNRLTPETKRMASSTEIHDDYDLSFIPTDQKYVLRMAMTLLLGLIVVGILFTIVAVPQYALLIGSMWTLLVLLFGGFVWFVQTVSRTRGVFHPVIHAAAAAVMREYEAFTQDWRDEVLLLTDGRENQAWQTSAETEDYVSKHQKRKAKSKIFRWVVKPFVPLLTRRKRRRKERGQGRDPDGIAADYLPPDTVQA